MPPGPTSYLASPVVLFFIASSRLRTVVQHGTEVALPGQLVPRRICLLKEFLCAYSLNKIHPVRPFNTGNVDRPDTASQHRSVTA